MHKGQNDEAITLLKKELTDRPAERIMILLASAYANRASVRVDSYWGFLIGYDNLLKNSKFFADSEEQIDLKDVLNAMPSEVRKSVQDLNLNLRNLYQIRKRLDQIPLVNETQQKDLLLAIETLEDAKTQGGRLYRGILELILLRTAAETSYQILMDVAKNPKLDCRENLGQAVDWIRYTNKLFQNLLEDVILAFPSQSKEVESLQSQSKDLLKNLSEGSKKVQSLLCAK